MDAFATTKNIHGNTKQMQRFLSDSRMQRTFYETVHKLLGQQCSPPMGEHSCHRMVERDTKRRERGKSILQN